MNDILTIFFEKIKINYKSFLFLVFVSYGFILLPYFVHNNMQLQFDINLLSLIIIVTFSIFLIMVFVTLYMFILGLLYTSKRLLYILYKKQKNKFIAFLLLIGLIIFLISISIIFNDFFNNNPTISKILTFISIAIASYLIYSLKPYDGRLLLTLSIVSLFIIFHLNFDILIPSILILIMTLFVLYFLYNNHPELLKNKTSLYQIAKGMEKNNVLIKLDFWQTITLLFLSVWFLDTLAFKGNVLNFLKERTFDIFSIGSYKGKIYPNKNICERINICDGYYHIVWSNSNLLFIRTNDNNRTIVLKKENLLLFEPIKDNIETNNTIKIKFSSQRK